MKITIDVPETVTVGEHEIATGKWTAAFVMHEMLRGIKEDLTNARAGKKGADAEAATAKVLTRITAGDLPTGGGGTRLTDVEREARTILTGVLVTGGMKRADAEKAIRAAGGAAEYVTEAGGDPSKLMATAEDNVARRDMKLDIGI